MSDIWWQFPYLARPLTILLQNDVIVTFLPSVSVKRMILYTPIRALTLVHGGKYTDTDWCSLLCSFVCISSFHGHWHGHGWNEKVWHPLYSIFNSMQRMPNKCTQNLSASCFGGEVHLIRYWRTNCVKFVYTVHWRYLHHHLENQDTLAVCPWDVDLSRLPLLLTFTQDKFDEKVKKKKISREKIMWFCMVK